MVYIIFFRLLLGYRAEVLCKWGGGLFCGGEGQFVVVTAL